MVNIKIIRGDTYHMGNITNIYTYINILSSEQNREHSADLPPNKPPYQNKSNLVTRHLLEGVSKGK